MNEEEKKVYVIGAGLAGAEAAYNLARRGIRTILYEMKPERFSPVHKSPDFAELVCSNSLGSIKFPNASHLLKEEMKLLGSLVVEGALYSKVPAGNALAVDRAIFSGYVTDKLKSLKNLEIRREEAVKIPKDGLVMIATGPLTSPIFNDEIKNLIGSQFLYFYDAISPIVDAESIEMDKAFFGSRYETESSDYLNIPLTKTEYYDFVSKLKDAKLVPLNDADRGQFFEGCLPIEEIAKRGDETLAYGPMKPVGFHGKMVSDDFYAVIQLRSENRSNSMFNIVGFQTRMVMQEQKRIFASLPALSNAKFIRFGQMHRNTFINSRKVLNEDLSAINNPKVYFAGQLAGVEGYIESAGLGLAVSLYMAARLKGTKIEPIPKETMLGALIHYITDKSQGVTDFQPMNSNFGILKDFYEIPKRKRSKERDIIFQNSLERLNLWYNKNFKE